MNNKGVTYIEVLAVLGITATITATTVSVCMNTKKTAEDKVEQYAATYEQMDKAIENGDDLEQTLKELGYEIKE